MIDEKDFGISTLILLNILIFTISSFEQVTFLFLFQSVFIAFYSFTCMSYFHTILMKKPSQLLVVIMISVMVLNSLIIPPNTTFIFIIFSSIAIITISLTIRIYKRKRITRKKDEIDRELNDEWEEEPHILFEESDIGKLV